MLLLAFYVHKCDRIKQVCILFPSTTKSPTSPSSCHDTEQKTTLKIQWMSTREIKSLLTITFVGGGADGIPLPVFLANDLRKSGGLR